ncbi:NADH-dependent reduced ferredoxin:NADP+ oxidoreductase subunit B [hydrothermal vent metagenome]|uniref:NADH-dependent reduced ferredoxin:NADP+ oxidoreductase subunit B n=1 Tax=hydrothermal vent metagenome TaxID=652676 RepID=A0A3B0SY65_9ZZZZ
MARELTRRERLKIPRHEMPEQDAHDRSVNFEEVNLGFTAEQAVAEAERCLLCAKPTCIDGCPVGIDIREFVRLVADEQFSDAADVIKRDNFLPAVCGRVCPQEDQCEGACVLVKRYKPLAIGHLERFVADYERERGGSTATPTITKTGKSVAVVGSGPSGLACAADLIQAGHDVTVFEALHELGGVLVYGIPEFRLPKEIVKAEVDQLADLGVRFEMNAVIGMIDTIDELLADEGYDAVFIGVGAGLPRFLGVPGENLVGVYSANEFLTRINLMRSYAPGAETPLLDLYRKTIAVFGGGNTAMDAVRTARRLGADPATIFYRRSDAEMPARAEEVAHARAEGIGFETLVSPIELIGNEDGWLTGARFQRMVLGEPDDSGRRRPQPIPGDEFEIPIDIAVVAIGNEPNPLIHRTAPDLEQTAWGTIVADPETGRTAKKAVFAGGDIVTGGATVILAMGAGRRAAASINEYLDSGVW